jgi:UDP-glucose 4-epimerase
MKQKVLVTGGTGYIGSHTTVELIKKGYEVIIADNLSNSYEWIIDRIDRITGIRPFFFQCDLTDYDQTELIFKKHPDIDGVIHFAALKAVGESVKNPLLYYHNNLNALLQVLKVMQKYNCINFVFSSSCTVYGQPDQLPVSENSPILPPESPYGNTKQISEKIITDYSASTTFKSIILRYFNPIGAHESALIGELPIGIPNNLIPFIMQTATGKREVLNVFGNDYNTPDGSCIRDFVHVVDLSKAHIIALERLFNGVSEKNIEIFNLGTGKGVSVLELINRFQQLTKINIHYRIAPRREGDIEQIWADTSLANSKLGWEAEMTVDEMLLSAWKWENEYLQ